MDGNGRWAQAQGQPRIAGHQAGVETARRIVKACIELRIRVLTLYVFSTENWDRPPGEVSFLMRLAEKYALNEALELHKNGVRLQLMGRRQKLPPILLGTLDEAMTQTQSNKRMILNLAINYGGRTEIVDAAKSIIRAHRRNEINLTKLDEVTFARFLYCPDIPDVDLIIRTGGEHRLSNFLLWRSVKAWFWSTLVYWPDFQAQDLSKAIDFYRDQITRLESEKNEYIA